MRSLLLFGARSMRHKDVFDIYYRLRIKEIDVGILNSCTAKGVFGNESMHEESWADVRARLEKVFEDRCYVRQLSGARGNWLELLVGKVSAYTRKSPMRRAFLVSADGSCEPTEVVRVERAAPTALTSGETLPMIL